MKRSINRYRGKKDRERYTMSEAGPLSPPAASSREAEAVFKHIDTNGDGELDPRELQCRLSDFGVEVSVSSARAPLRPIER